MRLLVTDKKDDDVSRPWFDEEVEAVWTDGKKLICRFKKPYHTYVVTSDATQYNWIVFE